ncbi:MAG: PfkB family carbohydrate kinase [Amaricoccus sp.]
MPGRQPILCVGAALWDVIGRAERPLPLGGDVPGRVIRRPGGVALNVAFALAALGQRVTLLAAVGDDDAGEALARRVAAAGVDTAGVFRYAGATDTYVAIEDERGELHAAVADCAGLEAAGAAVLAPLRDGRLPAPWPGRIVADGNLPASVLAELLDRASDPGSLALVPASPGKASLLGPLSAGRPLAVYVNRLEAEVFCGARFENSRAAAAALRARGAAAAIVTDGAAPATAATAEAVVTLAPPAVRKRRSVTGAGDAFVAAHLVALAAGHGPEPALAAALEAAARHLTGRPT